MQRFLQRLGIHLIGAFLLLSLGPCMHLMAQDSVDGFERRRIINDVPILPDWDRRPSLKDLQLQVSVDSPMVEDVFATTVPADGFARRMRSYPTDDFSIDAFGHDTATFRHLRFGAGTYSFLAAGHWYGAHENTRSTLPAATLYHGIGHLRFVQADWTFILGDVVRDAGAVNVLSGLNDLTAQLGGRQRIVLGNHDLSSDGKAPRGLFSDDRCLNFHGDQFLLLNTESLRFGGGKAMLEHIATAGRECPSTRNLFVFSHRLLWALAEPGMIEMDDFANEPFAPLVSADTVQMIYQAVLGLAGKRPLHWFSGDLGASWSENVFYDHSADHLRHFYAAGLGDGPDDAFWHVEVDSLGNVNANLLMLNGQQPQRKDYYSLAGWRERMTARREAAQVPLGQRMGAILRGRNFWMGFVAGVIACLLVCEAIRRIVRRKTNK